MTIERGRLEEIRGMLTPKEVLQHVTAEPYRPFRISMASGRAFDIRHPEMFLVGRTSARVHTVTDPAENEKWHDGSLMLMETIQPLDPAIPQAKG